MPVNYNRINFRRRVVKYPRSYTEAQDAGGGITHTPSPGEVVQEGVLPDEENLNKIDKGIKDCADAINAIEETLRNIANTLTDIDTRTSNNERAISSLQSMYHQLNASVGSMYAQLASLSSWSYTARSQIDYLMRMIH